MVDREHHVRESRPIPLGRCLIDIPEPHNPHPDPGRETPGRPDAIPRDASGFSINWRIENQITIQVLRQMWIKIL